MITINISDNNWKKLNKLKKPGQSFDAVLSGLFSNREEQEEADEQPNAAEKGESKQALHSGHNHGSTKNYR